MIRVDKNEQFIITVALYDENTNQNISGQTVYYDIRDASDNSLSPPAAGTMDESSVESGIYKSVVASGIPTAGNYIIYATCSGFNTNIEELIVNEENIYEVAKQTQNYNISVEEVLRTTVSGNPGQIARNVPLNKTDYIITWIKADTDPDWSNPVTSGTVYAWYASIDDNLPYKMGSEF